MTSKQVKLEHDTMVILIVAMAINYVILSLFFIKTVIKSFNDNHPHTLLHDYTLSIYVFISELTSTNALRLLVKSGFDVEKKWTRLTGLIGVSLDERRRLVTVDQDHHFALEEGLQWWIDNCTSASWSDLISAVEDCGDSNVATKMKREIGIGK